MNSPSHRSHLWFKPQSLVSRVKYDTWCRGMLLYRNTKSILKIDLFAFENGWVALGKVKDTRLEPYDVSIEFSLSPNFEVNSWVSECTCFAGNRCKHSVVIMLEAAYKGDMLLKKPNDNDQSHLAIMERLQEEKEATRLHLIEIEKQKAENELLNWLKDIEKSQTSTQVDKKLTLTDGVVKVKHTKVEQYLFLMSWGMDSQSNEVIRLNATSAYRKLNGQWSKPKPIRQYPSNGLMVYEQAKPQDHEVMELIKNLSHQSSYLNYFHEGLCCTIKGKTGLMALEGAAATERLFLKDDEGYPDTPIQWGAPIPLDWSWQKKIDCADSEEPEYYLKASINDPACVLYLNTPPLYINYHTGHCGPVKVDGINDAQLQILIKAPALKLQALKKYRLQLLKCLGSLPPPPGIENHKIVKGVTPDIQLTLKAVDQYAVVHQGLIKAQLRFDYQGYETQCNEQGEVKVVEDSQGDTLIFRDLDTERAQVTKLEGLGLIHDGEGDFILPGLTGQQLWPRWADEEFQVFNQAGFNPIIDASLTHWIERADELVVKMQSQNEGEDWAASTWFDLSLGVEIAGKRHNILPWLPRLIEQAGSVAPDAVTGLPQMPEHVYLPAPEGKGFIRLPTAPLKPWLAALLELMDGKNFSADSLRLSRNEALRTSATLGEGALWEGARAMKEMVQQLSGQVELPIIDIPQNVLASLRPYQHQGLNWLQFLSRYGLAGILADDMGLGKTLQTLVHIQVEKNCGRLTHPALIIAPVSLMGNWLRETKRFCPELRCLVLHGKDRHDVAHTIHEHDIIIAPYSLMKRDQERWLEAQWHIVVLDEAQNIKNASTHAAQIVGQLNTRHRLCLSGTPLENHLGELWSLFHFLMPGFLGSQKQFSRLFRTPIEKLGDIERSSQLRRRITPFMLRRAKSLVAQELPPKVETVLRVELSGKQADLYETIRLSMEKAVREALANQGMARSQITILDALLKLRQVCCDPRLVSLELAKKIKVSAKLEQLMQMLPEMLAEGRKILLFSQFTSMLSLIEAELIKLNIKWVKLTGQSQNRDALIERFTSGEVPLFLISLKAGGVGLNLAQADTVIHYDPWWNPAAENQATDRAHRIGQTQSVWVVKLVAQGTIEERILSLQERKAELAQSMYSGSLGRKQPLFTENDLQELLKPLSSASDSVLITKP